MIEAWQVVKYSFRDLWDEFVLLIAFNLVWGLAVLLPIVPFLLLPTMDLLPLLGLALLLMLPLPIVTGSLCFVTNQVTRGIAPTWRMFGLGIRKYWLKSLVVGLVNLVALIVLVANFRFYTVVVQGSWTILAVTAWLVVAVYWLLVQVFWFPMILELESEKVFVALRHSLGMVIITPAFMLTLAIVLAIILAVSLVLAVPILVFTTSLVFLITNHATRSQLAHIQKKNYTPGPNPE